MPVAAWRRSCTARLLLLASVAVTVGSCRGKEPTPVEEPPPPPPPPQPAIGLSATTLAFTDTVATANPAPIGVNVTNAGTGTLTGLGIGTITYSAGANGWVTFAFSAPDAPTTLTIQPSLTGLDSGTYTATIPVTSTAAGTSPKTITVAFSVAPQPPPPPDPPPPFPPPAPIPGVVVVATGNIAKCGSSLSTASAGVVAAATPDYVFVLGDNAYPPSGSPAGTATSLTDYQNCYDPAWGQFKAITYAAVGNREQGADTLSPGADAYFGPERVGPPKQNYYSFNVGTGSSVWHIIVLDILSGGPTVPVPYGNSSAQLPWLRNDLAANSGARCTLVFWHDPMWTSSNTVSSFDPNAGYRRQPQRGIWMALYDANVDVVLGGGDHIYERFAPMRYVSNYPGPEFAADSARGIMQFSTGLGGDGPLQTPAVATRHPLSQYRSGGNGVLKLTLGDGVYTWQFLNTTNSNVQDWGSGTCH